MSNSWSGFWFSIATATISTMLLCVGAPAQSPSISSISPSSGVPGTQVQISGSGFGASQGSSTVTVNNIPATTIASWTDTSIAAAVPYFASTGDVVVTVGGVGSNGVSITVPALPSRPVGSSLDSSNPLSTNLVGLFIMNEGTGTSDEDLVDNEEANFSGANLPTWNTSDPSIVFDGGASLNSYVNAGTDLTFDQLPTNQITILAKVYVSSLANAGVCEKNDDNAIDSGFVFGWDNTGALRLTVEKSSTNMRVAAASGTIATGQWMQVAFTWDGTVGTAAAAHLFVNGVEQTKVSSSDGSGTLGYANATNQPFRIGNADFDFAGSLAGNLAYLAVYRGTILTTSEMGELDAQLPIVLGQGSGPTISSLSPDTAVPGGSVTISGVNFGSTQGTGVVTFNGTTATPTSWNASSIVVPVPTGATSGNVFVTVGGVISNGMEFTVSQTPSINSVSPSSGPTGTSVTISGVNFGSSQGSSSVTFNGTAASPTTWTSTSIVVPAPSGATTGNVVVTTSNGTSNGVLFTVLPVPSIANLSSSSATIGSLITITGTNFGSVQGSSTVTFNGVAGSPAAWSQTSIVVPVPEGSTTGNVVVTENGLASNGVTLTIVTLSLPPVADVQPANGASGFPENGRIIVRFAQPVSAAAIIPGTVSLSQGTTNVAGNLRLSNDGLSVTFTPSQNLSASATLSVSVTDLAGNQTSPEFQSTFTTGSTTDNVGPTILETSPQNSNIGVPISAPIVAQFSKEMDPATLTPQNLSVEDTVTGQILSGMVQVDATCTTASFIPQTSLGVGRTFDVSLSSNITDSSGNSLTGSGTFFSFTSSFTADTAGPQILGMSPVSGASAVPLNALIVLEFNKPLDVISVSNGLQVQSGGQTVAGAIALSNSNQRVTFTPVGGLTANTNYSVVTTSEITDVGGLALTNPTSSSFTSGSANDTTMLSVDGVSPINQSSGAPTNGIVQLQFNKPVDPLTVTPSTLQLITEVTNVGIPQNGTVSVSADGLTATFTPSATLNAYTTYWVEPTAGITDLEGNALSSFDSSFTTGSSADSTSPTVQVASPANGATGVPVNVRVDLEASAQLDPASVTSGSVVLSVAGTSIPGTVGLSNTGTTLTYSPSGLLTPSTTYAVSVSGATDLAGNPIVPFNATFTTGTSASANTTQPSVASTSPTNGATAVSVKVPIALTFTEPIDTTTVSDASVPISASGVSGTLAGSYTLDATGTVLTFTPLSPLPANATIVVQVEPNGVFDLSGNGSGFYYGTFSTGTGTDATAPTIQMVTPSNGSSGISLNMPVVLTFSKSLNPNTANPNNLSLLMNGAVPPGGVGITTSADNRVVSLNGYGLPPSSTITVVATSGITDLYGNALANFQSSFTTAPAPTAVVPFVVSQRPGNGATGVPVNDSIVLYFSQPMSSASLLGAVNVAANGGLVSGTTQLTDNGQVLQFTPSPALPANALVQVFVAPSAQGTNGVNMNNYQSSFTTQANATTTASTEVNTNPANATVNVPTNVVIDLGFSEALDPTTLTATTILCFQNGAWFQSDIALISGGTVVQVVPRVSLQPNAAITCQVSTALEGTNGIPSQGGGLTFNTGSAPDTVPPTITTISPPNGLTQVGDNVNLRLVFSKPINPLTINSSSIQLSGGGATVVPDSISFSNNNQTVFMVPHAPLPDNTLMTLSISGVTDVAGNPVATQTVQFTTGAGPDVVPPVVVWANPLETNPYNAPTNIPLNAIIQVLANEPIDPGTVNSTTFSVLDPSNGNASVSGTYSVSTDGLTITFVPSAALQPSHQYSVNALGGMTDLAGNVLTSSAGGAMGNFTFTTGTTTSTTAPQVTGVSPANGAMGIPLNAQVAVSFNEPIDAVHLSGLTLTGAGSTINASLAVSNGNQTIALVPSSPLAAGTQYTLNVTGVRDFSGNVMTTPITSTFTTGNSADITPPAVASTTPANYATGISTNAAVQVQFSKAIDPLTVLPTTFYTYPYYTGIPVAGTISVSSNGQMATLTPSQPLDSLTFYDVQLTSGIRDIEGQTLGNGSTFYFTTSQGTSAPPPVIQQINPSGAAVGAAVNINGSYFGTSQGSSTVTFNGVQATPTSWSDAQIIVPVPNGATTGNVAVTVSGTASNSVLFTVQVSPVLSSISPASATIGTVLTLTGSNFGDPQDTVMVQFSTSMPPFGQQFTPISRSESSITVAVPSDVATGVLYVAVGVNFSNGITFTLIPTPNIASLTTNSGVAGTVVGVYGTNFGSSQGSSTISFNGVPASVTGWSDTYIVAVAPSNVTTGPVTVVENSIPSNSNVVFTATNPAIGTLSPPAGAVGATVTLTGSALTAQGLATQVFFNGTPANVSSASSTSLTVQVPSNATTGSVTVEVGAVSSNSLPFTVEQSPTITSVSPNQGPFASDGSIVPITITGSGFGASQSNSAITFYGSNTSPTIQSWSDNSITLAVPLDATTGPLTVQVGTITATAPSWFHVNQITNLTDSLGNQTQYTFGIQGGQWFTVSSQGPGCSTCTVRGNITNTSDQYGNVITSADDLGNTTTFTYDLSNDMTSASKPLNSNTTQATSYTYNSFGEVLTMTDPLGNVTTDTYDAHGNLLTVTTPAPNANTSGSTTQFQYAGNGELTRITDPLGNLTTLTYTSVGLIASITDAQNNITTYQYDARGNRTAVIDPINGASHPTSFSYDIMNRLTGITYPDGSTVSFAYDVRGRRTSATDQNGKTTYYTYDDADRLTAVTDPANNKTQYAYDTEDNLLSITDANSHTTQFAYNNRGWVTQTTFPSTLTESYTYDLVGNLLSKTDRKGNTIQYVYDALYRLTQKSYPDQTAVEYAYDLAGKVQQVSDPTGSYGFAYDNMGRLIGTSTQYAWLPSLNFQNAYTYDAASNRQSLTAPDGSTTTYGYDTLNRLNSLGNSWAGSFGFGYDALSRRTSLTRPNGVNTSYSYDGLSHLLSVLHHTGSTTLDGASYTYDPAGNRTAKTNNLNGITSNYSYDALYELTQVTQGTSTTESYSYDAVGNRLSSSGVSTYSYNSSNELTSNSNGSYTYDANGNTLSDAQGRSFTWDFENRMTQAVVPGTNGGTTTFKYDPFGRRIQKSGPLGTTNYLYDGNGDNDIEEVDSSGNVLARYTEAGLDEQFAELRSGTTSYYQQDGLNSVTSLTNSAGALANTYSYDSFGNVTNPTGTVGSPFQYTGRELDSETGLNYNRARYYSPTTGRFISEDPLGFGGSGSNFYPYVRNDPADLIDPLGLTNCVVTPLGTVCSDTGLRNSWLEPTDPPGPPLPPGLKPDPSQPAPPPCKCDMVEYGKEIDRVVWKNTKHEIFFWEPIFVTGEGGAEFFGWQFGKRWIPAVKWVKVGVEVYDTYEEVEKIREKYRHCGWY